MIKHEKEVQGCVLRCLLVSSCASFSNFLNLILVLGGILSRVFVTPGDPFCLMISARHLDAFTSHLSRNLLHHLPFPLSFSHPLLHPDAYPV